MSVALLPKLPPNQPLKITPSTPPSGKQEVIIDTNIYFLSPHSNISFIAFIHALKTTN